MSRPLHLVVLGLSISSAWGNGHATTYRALLRAFAARGHSITFLERDVPWYAAHRDPSPDFCRLQLYESFASLGEMHETIATADAVMLGSYVPEGIRIGEWLQRIAQGLTIFYDIDTPVTLAKLDAGACEYVSPELIPGFSLYLSFAGGRSLRELKQRYHARAVHPLYCSVDTDLYREQPTSARWDLSYLGTYSPDRQVTLERLLLETARQMPERRFCVAGSKYPAEIDWPANVERIDHVPPLQHPMFYASSRYTLNVTRADMIAAGHSPSVRIFEAAACGTPLISDHWVGIEDFLEPDKELVIARTSADVRAALSAPESERNAMRQAARKRIIDAHSAHRRAQELETLLLSAMRRQIPAPMEPQMIDASPLL
jgi:spore maturation protein CgeB